MSEQTFGGYEDATEAPVALAKAVDTSQPGISLLDELLAEADVAQDLTETFAIRGREGWTASFSTDFGSRDIKRWNQIGQGKRKRAQDADQRIVLGSLLVEQNTGVYKNGAQVFDAQGDPLTFQHQAFVDAYTKKLFVKTAIDAVMEFMGEGQAFSMANSLTGLAGFGDDLAPVDPTNG